MKKIGLEHVNDICGICKHCPRHLPVATYILAWMVVCIRPCLVIITLLTSVNVETLWDEPEQALEELLPTVLKLASYHEIF